MGMFRNLTNATLKTLIMVLVVTEVLEVKPVTSLSQLRKDFMLGSNWKLKVLGQISNTSQLPNEYQIDNSSKNNGWVPLLTKKSERNSFNNYGRNEYTEVTPQSETTFSTFNFNGSSESVTPNYVFNRVSKAISSGDKNGLRKQVLKNEDNNNTPVLLKSEYYIRDASNSRTKQLDFLPISQNGTSGSELGKLSAMEILIKTMADIQSNLHKILELTLSKKEKSHSAEGGDAYVMEQKTREQELNPPKRAASVAPQGSILVPRRFPLSYGGYNGPPNINSKRAANKTPGRHDYILEIADRDVRASERKRIVSRGRLNKIDNATEGDEPNSTESNHQEHLSDLIDTIKNISSSLNDIESRDIDNYESSRRARNNIGYARSRSLKLDQNKNSYGLGHGYNSLNHLPPDPLMALFLSHYGKYLPGMNGRESNFRNLYSYTASNNMHNNQPFGAYKVYEDKDN